MICEDKWKDENFIADVSRQTFEIYFLCQYQNINLLFKFANMYETFNLLVTFVSCSDL